MASSSQQADMSCPPYQFNQVSEVEYDEEFLAKLDLKGPHETHGVTVEQLAEARVSSIMRRYSPHIIVAPLSPAQRDALQAFLDCVVSSIYRFAYRKPHPPTCTAISAAVECLPYRGCWRDTIRVKLGDPTGDARDQRLRPVGQRDLALIWSLAVRRAEGAHGTADVLPTNIALDIGLSAPYSALAILGPDALGKFNLRDALTAVNNVIELGEFHPNAPQLHYNSQ